MKKASKEDPYTLAPGKFVLVMFIIRWNWAALSPPHQYSEAGAAKAVRREAVSEEATASQGA